MNRAKDLDGFESEREGEVAELKEAYHKSVQEANYFLNHLILKDIDPPQQIKTRAYSLEPDIITGWSPKFTLPKPITLIYPDAFLASLLHQFIQLAPPKTELTYLGPRYDNTYSAWKYLSTLEFPYKHLSERKIVLSDRIFVGNNPKIQANSLHFNSMFESGNLDAVFKVNEFQYDCFMRIDANTRGHLQWYNFQVTNLKRDQQYRINICNFKKSKSLYLRGMKPYILSKQGKQLNNQNWKQSGQIISYCKQKSSIQKILTLDQEQQEQFLQLSLKISTSYQNDTLVLAYCPPYTYTHLLQFIVELVNKHINKDVIYYEHFSNTLSGLSMPLVTITNNAGQEFQHSKELRAVKNKKLVFVMGRIHPGQSNSSFMVQGLINWLCNNTKESYEIRQRFIFKILPMVNPDGVIIGNYRTGLSGRDFNRQFIDPDKSLFVEINAIKSFIYKYKKIYHSSFTHFLDFHGHTIKKNIFTYGPQFPITNTKYYQCRILPKLISKKTNLFRYFSCKFNVSKGKQSTARAVLIRQFYIPYSYTIQASNGFYTDGQQKNIQFTIQKWVQAGQKICESLYGYVIILKAIEVKRQERKKQKELRNKYKIQRYKKHSSLTKATQFNVETSKSKKEILQYRFQEQSSGQLVFNDLIDEINTQHDDKQLLCSDDQLSQGKSDSENAKDDIDFNQQKKSIFVANEQKITKNRNSQNHLRVIRIIKRNTLTSEIDNKTIEEKKAIQFMRPRRSAIVRKKMQSINFTPSPVKGESIGTAKIININFQLYPVQSSFSSLIPQEKNRRMKTQTGMGMIQAFQSRNSRNERSDSFRRTFINVHRDTIRRQSNKKIKNYSTVKSSLKVQQIVGKRIFTETSY